MIFLSIFNVPWILNIVDKHEISDAWINLFGVE